MEVEDLFDTWPQVQPPFLSRTIAQRTANARVYVTPLRLSRAFRNRKSQHLKTCCGDDQSAESSPLKGQKVKLQIELQLL